MTDVDPGIDATVLPPALRDRDQWVCWRAAERDGKPTKIPVTPGTGVYASATEPETWAAFETARDDVATDDADGIGFVFTDDDPIVGVDLDDCRDPETGEVDDTAQDIIDRLDSYTEISPSGTGYHVLIRGDLPNGRNRRGSVELYDTARFFTVTGDHVGDTPTHVARRQDALEAIHREYVQEVETDADTDTDTDTDTTRESRRRVDADTSGPDVEVDLDDEELLRKARTASNGEKFERLWNGNIAGYDSQSEADMALCCLLAFWTGGDQSRMDRLFRQSGLHREKWDEVHYADGSTYGEKTIGRAVEATSEFYEPTSTTESEELDFLTNTFHDNASNHADHSHAYLVEKNRLLRERVSTLESTLNDKTESVESLKAELERLDTTQTTRIELRTSVDRGNDTSRTNPNDKNQPESSSLLERTKQLFGLVSK